MSWSSKRQVLCLTSLRIVRTCFIYELSLVVLTLDVSTVDVSTHGDLKSSLERL